MQPSRRLAVALLAVGVVLALASCHQTFHPLEVAEQCNCSAKEYCHVQAGAPPSCVAIPAQCPDPPTCGCLGHPLDSCREELGRFTVLEQRPVAACDDCSSEEYCWNDAASGKHACGLIPARCEESPSCDCFVEARRSLGQVVCEEHHGRIQAGLVEGHSPQ